MKSMKRIPCSCLCLLLLAAALPLHVAAQEDTAAVPVVRLRYFNNNNSLQYLLLKSELKRKKVLSPQAGKSYELYLDSAAAPNLVARVRTDASGMAKAVLPPSLKTAWDAKPTHTFLVRSGEEEVITDYAITKARLSLDTLNEDGVRSIRALVLKSENGAWAPAADVELKIGAGRLGSILPAGDEATYTTDSSGTVTVEWKKIGLPGDASGRLVLRAQAEDNELLGNLQADRTVAWGTVTRPGTDFFQQRTLWTTGSRTPYWLLFLVLAIVAGVWGTLFYLIWQIRNIWKLGKTPAAPGSTPA